MVNLEVQFQLLYTLVKKTSHHTKILKELSLFLKLGLGNCRVLTDTPEKKALEAAKLKKTESKKKALKLKSVHKAKKMVFGQAKKYEGILNPSGKNKATK